MPSDLQRVAQGLVDCLNEIPRVIGALQQRAATCREHAALVVQLSGGSATNAAMQLDEAARRCEEAAHYLSMAPPKAQGWAQQMVDGIRTVGPTGSDTARRPDALGGSSDTAERRRSDGQAKPEAKKSGGTAGAGDETSPEDEPATPRISDEEGWRLFSQLPDRDASPVSRPKTRGIWKDADGNEHDLASGQRRGDREGEDAYYRQVVDFMREHKIGRQDADPMVASHVEAKFALFMRERGLKHETIVVNKTPCDGDFGCDTLLDRFLPPGGTLTVFGPGGFKKTYPKPE